MMRTRLTELTRTKQPPDRTLGRIRGELLLIVAMTFLLLLSFDSSAQAAPGMDKRIELEHGGETRHYWLYLPVNYSAESVHPVLIGVHGYGGSGRFFKNEWAKLGWLLDREGIIGVFPDGVHPSPENESVRAFNDLAGRHDRGPDGLTCVPPPYDYPTFDNCPLDETDRVCPWGVSCADDAGFFRRVIENVRDTYAVDPARIYMVGYSQGGSTVHGLAPDLSDLLAAVVPMHGFLANGFAKGPDSPLPYMLIWGRADTVVRGDGEPSDDGLIYDSAGESAAAWAASQRCSDSGSVPWPSAADGLMGWSCSQFTECVEGAEVVSCAWDGVHVWPRTQRREFGTEVIWQFLKKQYKQ